LYPLTMTFALVYSGEHYFVDVLAGWLIVVMALVLGGWLRKRFGWVNPFTYPSLDQQPQLIETGTPYQSQIVSERTNETNSA
jgi:membrane-associated phospholipid phosphatase